MSRIVELPYLWCVDCGKLLENRIEPMHREPSKPHIAIYECPQCHTTVAFDMTRKTCADLRQRIEKESPSLP
jgi:Zn finger protein HypA/HybF involved in hydrogenase expression